MKIYMARICPLFSGSSGNATLIGNRDGYILIDAGVSCKRLREALSERDVELNKIAAIFITHDHSDHISGLRVFAGSMKVPVFATEQTLSGIESANSMPIGAQINPLPCNMSSNNYDKSNGVEAAGMGVYSFATSHDTPGSCGFIIETSDHHRIAVATDMGVVTEGVRRSITGCDVILLESNYDRAMLEAGGYPYYLKRRILSDRGHLCNDDCAAELPMLCKSGASRFILGHLSRENNIPAVARQSALCQLQLSGLSEGLDFMLSVADPSGNGMIIF